MNRAKIIKEDRDFPSDALLIAPVGMASDAKYIFIREFVCERKPENAEMYLCGSDCFDVFINGVAAASYALRSYAFCRAYEVYDVADFLAVGKNEIIVKYTDASAPVFRGFLCELIIDGERMKMPFWFYDRDRSRTFVSHYINRGGCEIFDARRAPNLNSIRYGETFTEATSMRLPDGASLYQSRRSAQKKTQIFPVGAKYDGTIADDDKPQTFEMRSEGVIISRFTSPGGKISLEKIAGVRAFFIDGEPIPDGEIDVGAGRHTLAAHAFGVCSIRARGAEFSEWRASYLAPKERRYTYPWNDNIQPYKTPDTVVEIAKNTADTDVFPDEYDYLFPTESLWHNILSYKTVDDSKCDLSISDDGKAAPLHRAEKKRSITYDFGRERAGFLKISFEADAGAEVEFYTFEMYDNGAPRLMNEKSCGKVISPAGKCKFTSERLRGFRYATLLLPADVEISSLIVSAVEMMCDTADAGAFFSNDKKLDDIYKMSCDTAAVCMLDSYVDCPGYEQNVWAGDAAITGMVNMLSFGDADFDAGYLDMVAQSMTPGLRTYYRGSNPLYVNDTYLPCACFPTYPDGGIPIWSFSWVNHVIDHFMHFGKDDGFDARLAAVEECLRRAEAHFSPRGLFAPCGAWNLIEWANNDLSPYGEVSANNMMLCTCYTNVSNLFARLKNAKKANEYSKKAANLKEAINKYCWDDELSSYVDTVRDEDGYALYLDFCKFKNREAKPYKTYLSARRISVQTATFALLYDIADGKRKAECEKILLDDIARGKFRRGTPARRTFGTPDDVEAPGGIVRIGTPFFLSFALAALAKLGKYEAALDVIRREWGEMLDDGLKTCVETFKDERGLWGRSAAHAWSAAPAVFLKTEILGIKPIGPGYEKFTVEPHLCGLTYAEGAVPTPNGNIRVTVRTKDGKTDVKVDAPPECELIYTNV